MAAGLGLLAMASLLAWWMLSRPPERLALLPFQSAGGAVPNRAGESVGIGLAAFGTISEMSWGSDGWEGPDFGGIVGIAAVPATIGLAFIVLSFFNKNKD